MMIRMLILGIALAASSVAAPAATPTFDPLAFFTGALRGEGTLKVLTRPIVPIRVESQGRPDGNGGLILDQTIHEGSKPPRQRRWLLRPTSPTTLSGTGSDNRGRVTGRLDGNRLLLKYTMKNGLKTDQVLTLRPDGSSLSNRMTIRKFGITVAHVNEVITKLD